MLTTSDMGVSGPTVLSEVDMTREVAKQDIFEYIEVFYNRQRMHSSNDYLSPVEFESHSMAA